MLMRTSKGPASATDTASLGSPTVVVILVLMLGATIYLWRARYIRRTTAYASMAILVLAIAVIGVWTYSHPM